MPFTLAGERVLFMLAGVGLAVRCSLLLSRLQKDGASGTTAAG